MGGVLIRLGLPRHFKCTPVIMKNLKTFHPDTQCSQTEPETAVWKNNWTICDSLSRAILSAHYCTLVPVKTGWLRFDFEPPSPNRSLELPLSFHPPFGFYKKKFKKRALRFSPEACLHHLRQLPAAARLTARKNPGNSALITLGVLCADCANTLKI